MRCDELHEDDESLNKIQRECEMKILESQNKSKFLKEIQDETKQKNKTYIINKLKTKNFNDNDIENFFDKYQKKYLDDDLSELHLMVRMLKDIQGYNENPYTSLQKFKLDVINDIIKDINKEMSYFEKLSKAYQEYEKIIKNNIIKEYTFEKYLNEIYF